MVQGLRGHTYFNPVAPLRAYAGRVRDAPYRLRNARRESLTIVASLGPRNMALSSELADAHTLQHDATA